MDNCTALNWANLEWEGGVADKTWMLGLKLMKAKSRVRRDFNEKCMLFKVNGNAMAMLKAILR